MPWSPNDDLEKLETKQLAAGAEQRDPNHLRDLEQLSESIEILLCKRNKKGQVEKTRAKILIGPYPIKRPCFMEVKNKYGKQIQINLITYGVVKKHSGLYLSNKWIELV